MYGAFAWRRTVSWSKKFEEPVQLSDGSRLLTLRQAAQYILALTQVEYGAKEWRTAMCKIIEAADHGGATDLARTELLRAIQVNCPQVAARIEESEKRNAFCSGMVRD